MLFDRFAIERELGRGGAASVWLAFDRLEGRRVALKVLHPEMRRRTSMVKRLAAEAGFLRELVHPGIAAALGYFEDENFVALAMEYVAGDTLDRVLGERAIAGDSLPIAEIRRIFDRLAEAVEFAHARGVLHRDLKPQNIMIAEDGAVKVLDFGIAKSLEQDPHDATTQGRRIGSPHYLSPEGTRGEPATAAGDIFSLGSVLFEMITLRRAWIADAAGERIVAFADQMIDARANSAVEVAGRISSGERPRVSKYRAEAAGALERMVMKALAVEPAERFRSVEEMRRAFPRARRGRALAAVPALGVAVAVGLLITREDPPVAPQPAPAVSPRVQPQASAREVEPEVELSPSPVVPAPVVPRRVERERPPSAVSPHPLRAALADFTAGPRDLARMRALAAMIEENAAALANPEKRARILRIAKTSALAGDAEGLELAAAELLAEVGG